MPRNKPESVWDYPRPPAVEPSQRRAKVWVDGILIVDSIRGLRVLETSHPPTWYFPAEDVRMDLLRPNARRTMCEFKGAASYFDLDTGNRVVPLIAWTYKTPRPGYEMLKGHLCFYPSRADRCEVDGETVQPQEGDFYGGWVTSDVSGPFKGGAGTMGW